MSKKLPIWFVVAILLVFLAVFFFFFYKRDVNAPVPPIEVKTTEESTPASNALKDNDEILKAALNLYIQKKEAGINFTNGPCLGLITQDWVLDIAHDPRQPQDEKPENQCADFREGSANHYIEIDPDGKLIKSY